MMQAKITICDPEARPEYQVLAARIYRAGRRDAVERPEFGRGREAKVSVRNNVPETSSRAPGGSPMSTRVALSPAPSVERRILSIRGQRVMLDADLASLYGVSTRALNQAVKRNRERFPEDFMFRSGFRLPFPTHLLSTGQLCLRAS